MGRNKKNLRLEFEPIAQTDMLRMILEKRKQLSDEKTVACYINDAESLCRRIDNKMPQEEMIKKYYGGIKTINSSLYRYNR